MKTKAVIISGGMLEETFVLEELEEHRHSGDPCFLIGVDHGNLFLYEHQIKPDYIVGDFDSLPEEIIRYYKEETDVPVREFNPVKDATDTEIAVRLAMEKGCTDIFIYGATGTRLDHVLGNIQVFVRHTLFQEQEITADTESDSQTGSDAPSDSTGVLFLCRMS